MPKVGLVVAGVTTVLGTLAAVYYASVGLTLSHYDAKAHLVVARRIIDSLTPGWEQIGAVWLPLPHLINALPVQIDVLYRTGLFAIAVSIACHALAAGSIAATIHALTMSRVGAVLGATLYALNPNTLYLQSTPMTEPMLFGLTTLQVFLFTRWVLDGRLTVPRAGSRFVPASPVMRPGRSPPPATPHRPSRGGVAVDRSPNWCQSICDSPRIRHSRCWDSWCSVV